MVLFEALLKFIQSNPQAIDVILKLTDKLVDLLAKHPDEVVKIIDWFTQRNNK